MNVLSLDDVSKTLLDAPLFEAVTLGIDDGERIGFIGKNGTGKSTFLKILHGVLPPDTGTVSRHRELTMSGLEQHPAFTPGTTLREFCFHGRQRRRTRRPIRRRRSSTASLHSAASWGWPTTKRPWTRSRGACCARRPSPAASRAAPGS